MTVYFELQGAGDYCLFCLCRTVSPRMARGIAYVQYEVIRGRIRAMVRARSLKPFLLFFFHSKMLANSPSTWPCYCCACGASIGSNRYRALLVRVHRCDTITCCAIYRHYDGRTYLNQLSVYRRSESGTTGFWGCVLILCGVAWGKWESRMHFFFFFFFEWFPVEPSLVVMKTNRQDKRVCFLVPSRRRL